MPFVSEDDDSMPGLEPAASLTPQAAAPSGNADQSASQDNDDMLALESAQNVPSQAAAPSGNTAQPVNGLASLPPSDLAAFYTNPMNSVVDGTYQASGPQTAPVASTTPSEGSPPGGPQAGPPNHGGSFPIMLPTLTGSIGDGPLSASLHSLITALNGDQGGQSTTAPSQWLQDLFQLEQTIGAQAELIALLDTNGPDTALNPPDLPTGFPGMVQNGSGGLDAALDVGQDSQPTVAPAQPPPPSQMIAQLLEALGQPPGTIGSVFTAGLQNPGLIPPGIPNIVPPNVTALLSAMTEGVDGDDADVDDGLENAIEDDEDPILPSVATLPLVIPPPQPPQPSATFQATFMANLAHLQGNTNGSTVAATLATQNSVSSYSGPTTIPPVSPPGVSLDALDLAVGATNMPAGPQGGTSNNQAATALPHPNHYAFTYVAAPPGGAGVAPPVLGAGHPYLSFSVAQFIATTPSALNSTTFAEVWPALSQFIQNLVTNGPMNSAHRSRRPCCHYCIARFVDTLERVDISTIPAEDMRCPHCWFDFGTTDEDEPGFVYAPNPDDPPELAARQTAFREVPFYEGRANNDPVRTPCGHLFGRDCLIESMEKVDSLCPICRHDLRPRHRART